MHNEEGQLVLLDSQKNRLGESQRMVEHGEMIGARVLSDLRRQREAIERSLNSLQQADEELDSSGKTLDQMLKRSTVSRLLKYIMGH